MWARWLPSVQPALEAIWGLPSMSLKPCPLHLVPRSPSQQFRKTDLPRAAIFKLSWYLLHVFITVQRRIACFEVLLLTFIISYLGLVAPFFILYSFRSCRY